MEKDRVPTGIPGLDKLIQGGFPRNSVNLISGPAGSGKSLFGIQYLYAGRIFNERGLFFVLEENRSNVVRAMKNFGMDLQAYEGDGQLQLIDLGEIKLVNEEEKGIVGFQELKDFLQSSLKTTRARRLVIDSISAIGLHYRSLEDLREEMFTFIRFLRERDLTSLLITESIEGMGLTRYGIEQFVADSFIVLGLEEVKGELRRTLTIRKMRFTKHDTGKHPFLITPQGIEVSSNEKVV